MVLQLTDFQVYPYKLPNSISAPNGADATGDIVVAIDNYERELLIDGLGLPLYDLVNTATQDLGNATQALQDLVNGKQYTLDGRTVRYEGLKPLLKNYVYYKFLKDKSDIFTTLGVEKPNAVNSTSQSPAQRAVKYYRDFLKAYQGGQCENNVYRDRLRGVLISTKSNSSIRSLYQFLDDEKLNYPTAESFTIRPSTNVFSI